MILFYFLAVMFGGSFVEFVFAVLLLSIDSSRFHRFGIHLWAMSGWFLRFIPDHCFLLCDGSCKNWTCPRYLGD